MTGLICESKLQDNTQNNYHSMTKRTNAIGENYAISYNSKWRNKGIIDSIVDPTGRTMTFMLGFDTGTFYNTDYNGRRFKRVLNEKGKLIMESEIDAQGNEQLIKKIEYLADRVEKTTDALGNVTTVQKDIWDNVIKRTDAGGNAWTYTYNSQNKMLTATDPIGTLTKYEYDAYGNKTKETVASGTVDEIVTTYTYTQYNELASMTRENSTTYYSYNSSGRLGSITDPMGNVTTMTYDDAGNLLTRTQPLIGANTYEQYDYKGNPWKVTDVNGNVVSYTYDLLGRVLTTTNQSDGGTTEYFYVTTGTCTTGCGSGGGNGKIDHIVLPEGNRIDYGYDSNGKLIKVKDNDGNSINYTYDRKGNKTKEEIKDAGGTLQKYLNYTYDLLDRLQRTVNPDGSMTEVGYDARGNRKTVRNPNGNLTTYAYDPEGRLSKTTQPGNVITGYGYDRRGNLKGVTDANNNTTTYEYDKQNRLTKTISPDTNTTVYTYDLNGNLRTKTDAGNTTITYEYDALNRITKIDFPTETDIVYTYDSCINGKGRVCTMTDASGTTNYEYTAKGQVKKETKALDGVTYVTQYSYDMNGNMKTMIYPSGRLITYNYSNDRATSLLNNGVSLAGSIGYKPFGGMSSITYGNGIVGTTGYDNQYRISSINTGLVQGLSYGYDANGNITGITNNLDATKNRAFTYDALDRLTGATGPWGALNYSYDGVGNRQTETTVTGTSTYAYDANRLTSATGAKTLTFGYDNNGNTSTENSRQYIYNQNQRLIKVTEGSVTKGEYVYNGNGQRIKKTTEAGTVVFHYDQKGTLMAETSVGGGTIAEYVFLNGSQLAKIEGGAVYYYHNDHLGAPEKMTDSTGYVVWEGGFTPFGETISITGTITNNLRFPGQYYDEETGLHYNYMRDYDQVIGKYKESDPIGIEGGKNHLYIFVGNNPVNFVDPLGLESQPPCTTCHIPSPPACTTCHTPSPQPPQAPKGKCLKCDEKALEQCMSLVVDQPYKLPDTYNTRKNEGDAFVGAFCIAKHCKIVDCCEVEK